jgi:kynurenine 3-monooxygenase
MIRKTKKITINGAGLIGPYLGVLLRKRGFEVEIIEKRSDIRKITAEAGRSINLVLTSRGINALRKIDRWEEAKKITMPVSGRMMHSVSGELTYQPYGGEGDVNYSISRTELNRFLIDEAEKLGVKFYFSTSVIEIDDIKNSMTLKNEFGEKSHEFEVLIGADGAGSVVRKKILSLQNIEDRIDWLGVSYKELFMPTKEDGSEEIDKKSLHIWPRGKHMLMALPNLDSSFTMTLYLPEKDSEVNFDRLRRPESVQDYFEKFHPDSISLMPNYLEDFGQNKTSKLGTVRCSSWHYKGQMGVIGDAAHAIVPFFGQGTNSGLEGCVVFDELMDKYESWDDLFAGFFQTYKPNSDAIAKMAEENYIEMSERVGDEKFLLRKKLESYLHEKFPRKFMNRYMMVTYSNIPYATVYEIGQRQSDYLDSLDIKSSEDFVGINLFEVEKFLDSKIANMTQR